MKMQLLRELCEASGISGREERLRAIVRRELAPMVDELRVDSLGNLVGIRKGTSGKRLAINAHMDEIGFLVKHVDDKGFLRLHPVGGHDARNMVAQRVKVIGDIDLPGVLYPGQKPPHLQSKSDRDKLPELTDFFVDVGLPAARVKELVPLGTMVVIDRQFFELGDHVCCKAMDNRLSVYVMLEALRRTQKNGWEIHAVATTQEEVGVRGAFTSTYEIAPHVGIALDITIAADIPGVPDEDRVTRLGAGTAIKIMDSYSISSPEVVRVHPAPAGDPPSRWNGRWRAPALPGRRARLHDLHAHPLRPYVDRVLPQDRRRSQHRLDDRVH
jgi:putative aminopeptidase FrvX